MPGNDNTGPSSVPVSAFNTSLPASTQGDVLNQSADLRITPVTITAQEPIDPSRAGTLACADGARFDAIIFDMGTTLIEFENIRWRDLYRICVDAAHHRLIRMGHQPPDADSFSERFNLLLDRRRLAIREKMHEYRIDELLAEAADVDGVNLVDGELTSLCDAYYAPIRRGLTVYADAVPALTALREAGFPLGLLSNTCFRVGDHREELEQFGLWSMFDEALFTSTGTYRKPHPEPFELICSQMNVSPERCLYVGDRQKEDVLGPQKLGMTAALIRRPTRPYEPGLSDSVEIQTLAELPHLVHV